MVPTGFLSGWGSFTALGSSLPPPPILNPHPFRIYVTYWYHWKVIMNHIQWNLTWMKSNSHFFLAFLSMAKICSMSSSGKIFSDCKHGSKTPSQLSDHSIVLTFSTCTKGNWSFDFSRCQCEIASILVSRPWSLVCPSWSPVFNEMKSVPEN